MYIVNIFKLDQESDAVHTLWGGLNTPMRKFTREVFEEELQHYNVPQQQIDELLEGSSLAVHQWTDKWTLYIQSYKL